MSTEQKWTGGRWVFDAKSGTVNVGGGTICQRVGWVPDGVLIAAAPALYEALAAYQNHFGGLEDNSMLHEDARRCSRLSRAALAKARGE